MGDVGTHSLSLTSVDILVRQRSVLGISVRHRISTSCVQWVCNCLQIGEINTICLLDSTMGHFVTYMYMVLTRISVHKAMRPLAI